ncbi:hypothetical protein BC831DRAFT_465903, partial [Entophlyctis helioformis]
MNNSEIPAALWTAEASSSVTSTWFAAMMLVWLQPPSALLLLAAVLPLLAAIQMRRRAFCCWHGKADVRNVGLAECRAECAVLLWRRWAGLAAHTAHAVGCLWMLWAMLLVSHVLVSMRMRAVAGCLDRRLAPTAVLCLQFGCSCAAENAALWLWLWRFRAVMAHPVADCWHAAALHYCCCSMSRLLPGTRQSHRVSLGAPGVGRSRLARG